MTHLLSTLREVSPDRHNRAVQGLRDHSLTVTLVKQSDAEIRALVKNGSGIERRVIINDQYAACSCEDFFHRKATCKHLLAVCISCLQQPEQDNRIHLMRDTGHILCGATAVKRFWQNWSLNALNWNDLVCPACVHVWTHPAIAA